MITIELQENDVLDKYELPTSWDDIDIETFSKIANINPEIHSGTYYIFEVIHVLTGMDRDKIELMDFESFETIVENLKFIYEPVPNKIKESIVIDGEEYFIHKDFNKYKTGEIITIEMNLKTQYKNIYQILPKLLCVFLRKKIDGEFEPFTTKLLSREDKFKKIKIGEINEILSFFLSGKN